MQEHNLQDQTEISNEVEDQEEPQVEEVDLGRFRFNYYQQRANRQAQYAAIGQQMPPIDFTMMNYLSFCVASALAQ